MVGKWTHSERKVAMADDELKQRLLAVFISLSGVGKGTVWRQRLRCQHLTIDEFSALGGHPSGGQFDGFSIS
jgi:hypothetical protein